MPLCLASFFLNREFPRGINLLFADASAGEEAVNSRSSTPLEEEKYKVSELQLKMRYDARPAPRPRCRDYDGIFFPNILLSASC